MKISYLVPSYNHAEYVYDCLESIKLDMFCANEIIILDDGSDDCTFEIVKKWQFENRELDVKVLQQANCGISTTLNRLILQSNGDFIRPVASDDLLITGGTRSLVNSLLEAPNKLVAFGDVQTLSTDGKVIASSHMQYLNKKKNLYSGDLQAAIISEWAVAGPASLYRKNFFNNIGQFDESIIIEDWNMYLRLAASDNLLFVNNVVAGYRIHGANTSRTKNVDKRIKNLRSQFEGGEKCIALFKIPYVYLLKAELNLLQAKISFLRRDFFKVSLFLLKYSYLKLK